MLLNTNTPAATFDGSSRLEVLLILQDAERTLYRDQVLRHAGFRVTVMTTSETSRIADDALAPFGAVVLSDTIAAEDLHNISAWVRQHSPRAKIALIEDADCFDFDPSLSDITLGGLGGAAALVSAVRKLTGGSI